ncbi:spore protease YyaC [Brevibacillus aydinogluensis]|uniref:Spore protease YyaC n=2 Tax=Brevibacillus aydinogluensis TaxID=927786 RepID=A0AA48M6M8_9BACL|nr:spore protease YyaC [Brevibacillus sp. WF146]UYZ15159.1 spore protease YyaC [Brevibacillus sp. WF146]CAJ1002218.1 spore protease YyaC [Brevibacillus aydinogluensis]
MGFFGRKEPEVKQKVLCWVHDNERTYHQEIDVMSSILSDLIQRATRENKEIVFLCVGSDRSIGDALGPLVGTMLKENGIAYQVYGTLEEPVHAFNLEHTLKTIQRQFRQPFIISIDAGLGEREQVGAVLLKEGPLLPGRALQKVLPAVGDYHLTGVVNYLDPLPAAQFLNDTRLFTVMKLARTIVQAITNVTNNQGCAR